MKNRTFYATFLLFLAAIYICMLSLSVITLRGTMQQARRQCLNEQYLVAAPLYRDIAALEARGVSFQTEMDNLIQITGLSQRIAEGDYRERLPVHGTDEIGQMASSFNHMAEEIENKVTELAAAAENRQRFVDNFAHELRTPLTAIYGYAQYIQGADLKPEDAQFALATILAESRHMQQMANQLMELSGLRNGEIKMEPQKLSEILDFVSCTVEHKLSGNQIELCISSGVDTVVGDMVLLQSLLVNLIDNAAKASSAGDVITVQSFYEEGKAVITVSDQGKGMDAEELERIIEPYYRVDKARNRKEGGVGLGLAICSQIVKCHGALLTFQSEPGHGTTVRVSFTTS